MSPSRERVTVAFGHAERGSESQLRRLVGPEEGNALGDGTGNGARCRFTASTSAKKIRGAALYDAGSGYTTIVPAY